MSLLLIKKAPENGSRKNIVFLQEYPRSKLAQEAPRIAPCGGVRDWVGKVPAEPFTELCGAVFRGVFEVNIITFSYNEIV